MTLAQVAMLIVTMAQISMLSDYGTSCNVSITYSTYAILVMIIEDASLVFNLEQSTILLVGMVQIPMLTVLMPKFLLNIAPASNLMGTPVHFQILRFTMES